ncbi:hypothetical protein D0C36_04250 [Mucilaginibacter conchicola]|uniref:Uncharacterized protein n=1 Tax=Mucilaginibacter conchicola TaxID=2303333 RepID=A0A372NXB5_9SPHI|nr:tetratricopeptide repeat protein [Mucilaginibacter conchicola]RFZ94755.1 hypothetical protein D0C36_04250 [Mucilaginibacter conchicola]
MKAFKRSVIALFLFPFLTNTIAYAQLRGLGYIDSIKKDLKKNPAVDTNRIKSYYRIANDYTYIDVDSALHYADIGMALAQKLNFKKAIAAFHSLYADVASDRGEYDKAIELYNKAVSIDIEIGNKNNLASAYNNIGTANQRRGNFIESLKYNFRALKIAEEIKSYYLMGTLYNNISKVFIAQANYDKALYYSSKALKLHTQQHDKDGMASATNSIADVFYLQKNRKKANEYYRKAHELYKAVNNTLGEATALSRLGLIYEGVDREKKLSYLLEAQKMFDAFSPKHPSSITNIGNIGDLYAETIITNKPLTGKLPPGVPSDKEKISALAKQYLNRAISYATETDDTDDLSYFSEDLALLQEKEGDFKGALQNYRKAKGINDSLYSQQSKNKLAMMEAQYQFQKKEDAYKQQQQISALKMRQIVLVSVLVFIVAVAVMILLLNRARIKQLRLKNELQRKEAEEQARELLYRNKLSESELKAIRSQMNPHFIFNVLNSIESYVLENDSKTASRLVQKFATLSRLILENSTQSMVVAEREWKALKLYTELEAIRFNHQFSYEFYADPDLDMTKLMLPPMLVQPLIENSIHHGLRNSTAEKPAVNVRLEQTDAVIYFTVDDTGIGMDEAEKFKTHSSVKSKSIGLNAIRERIEIINAMNNGNHAAFEVRPKTVDEGTGTVAVLTLPKVLKST